MRTSRSLYNNSEQSENCTIVCLVQIFRNTLGQKSFNDIDLMTERMAASNIERNVAEMFPAFSMYSISNKMRQNQESATFLNSNENRKIAENSTLKYVIPHRRNSQLINTADPSISVSLRRLPNFKYQQNSNSDDAVPTSRMSMGLFYYENPLVKFDSLTSQINEPVNSSFFDYSKRENVSLEFNNLTKSEDQFTRESCFLFPSHNSKSLENNSFNISKSNPYITQYFQNHANKESDEKTDFECVDSTSYNNELDMYLDNEQNFELRPTHKKNWVLPPSSNSNNNKYIGKQETLLDQSKKSSSLEWNFNYIDKPNDEHHKLIQLRNFVESYTKNDIFNEPVCANKKNLSNFSVTSPAVHYLYDFKTGMLQEKKLKDIFPQISNFDQSSEPEITNKDRSNAFVEPISHVHLVYDCFHSTSHVYDLKDFSIPFAQFKKFDSGLQALRTELNDLSSPVLHQHRTYNVSHRCKYKTKLAKSADSYKQWQVVHHSKKKKKNSVKSIIANPYYHYSYDCNHQCIKDNESKNPLFSVQKDDIHRKTTDSSLKNKTKSNQPFNRYCYIYDDEKSNYRKKLLESLAPETFHIHENTLNVSSVPEKYKFYSAKPLNCSDKSPKNNILIKSVEPIIHYEYIYDCHAYFPYLPMICNFSCLNNQFKTFVDMINSLRDRTTPWKKVHIHYHYIYDPNHNCNPKRDENLASDRCKNQMPAQTIEKKKKKIKPSIYENLHHHYLYECDNKCIGNISSTIFKCTRLESRKLRMSLKKAKSDNKASSLVQSSPPSDSKNFEISRSSNFNGSIISHSSSSSSPTSPMFNSKSSRISPSCSLPARSPSSFNFKHPKIMYLDQNASLFWNPSDVPSYSEITSSGKESNKKKNESTFFAFPKLPPTNYRNRFRSDT